MAARERINQLVFVYGTLRQGCGNDHFLVRSRFIDTGWTRHRYALYLAVCPGVVKDEAVSRIRGEVYRVDPAVLAQLDQLEGHPDVYLRSLVPIDLDSGRDCLAWLYFYPEKHGLLLPGGDYQDADRPGFGIL